jgi:RNA polymerase sigma-70 factor (ECF subfamily)
VQEAALADLRIALEQAALFYIRRRLSGAEGVAQDEMGALAEDCSQEASLLVVEKLGSFRGEARFLTWAGAIAVGFAMTALRRKLWRDLSFDRMPNGWQEPAGSAVSTYGWANPEMAAQRQAIWQVIAQVVQTDLTVRQREVLNLVVINGVDSEEVAERFGMSPGALYKMTHDARRKLKAGLLRRGFSTGEILGAFGTER